MHDRQAGKWLTGTSHWGDIVFARLNPGGENSGGLVRIVKYHARFTATQRNYSTILIDGPPGIGCPVISTLSGADYALLVSEPTLAAISDLQRLASLIGHFKIPCGLVINKCDINTVNSKKISDFCKKKNIPVLAQIPHSPCIMEEVANKNIPSQRCPQLQDAMIKIYRGLQQLLKGV
jgi:MinD superfamily P-loop ATPase